MINIGDYASLLNKAIKVTCTDGDVIVGEWEDWTSEWDNEPKPESIIVRREYLGPVEIYVNEIKMIEKAKPWER